MPAGCGTNHVYSRSELLTFATIQPLDNITWLRLCQLGLSLRGPTSRGCRGGVPKERDLAEGRHRGINLNNLRPLNQVPPNSAKDAHLSLCTFNARSVLALEKAELLADFIAERDYDVVCLTETWWRKDTNCSVRIPPGYNVIHSPRSKQSGKTGGGGVAIIFKSHLDLKVRRQGQSMTFESIQADFTYQSTKIALCAVYLPRKPAGDAFFEEFSQLIDSYALTTVRPILVGDFNLHIDRPESLPERKFLGILNDSGFKQHVSVPTHVKGHTLDLAITRSDDPIVHSVEIHYPGLSDHFAVVCSLTLVKPTAPSHRWIMARKLKQVDQDRLKQDIQDSALLTSPDETLDNLIAQYNSTLVGLMDRHAPKKRRRVVLRPQSPWFNDEIRDAKQERHRLEKQWRSSKLQVHREMLRAQCNFVTDLVRAAKRQYYTDRVAKCGNDQKQLFQLVQGLLKTKGTQSLPKHDSDQELAESFNQFFITKIVNIRKSIGTSAAVSEVPLPDRACSLDHFTLTSELELAKILSKMSSSTCELDPIPSIILKNHLDILLPTLVNIVNKSLESGIFPSELKSALVRPLLKKPNLDTEEFKNYRPVSNLAFLGKVIEKVVALRLVDYLDTNQLDEPFQSAYRRHHGTETGLLRIQNDILTALDKNQGALLLLLDLSAAFDTIDHPVLLDRLSVRYRVSGTAHKWIQSYLSYRSQSVKIGDSTSQPCVLQFGVPQGSVMGPILYTMYAAPIGDVIRRHRLRYHIYADDTQIYTFFETEEVDDAVSRIEACAAELSAWMKVNMLKLSDGKTELLYLTRKATRTVPDPPATPVTIGDCTIQPAKQVRNLGILFDEHMTMDAQISAICSAGHFHLRNIGANRRYLTTDAAECLVHAFISSRLDLGNALLYGVPKSQIARLQRLQNLAARVITRTPKYNHITPVLKALHWLPVEFRIQYKILLLTFKAVHGQSPQYIAELLVPYTPPRKGLRSANQHLLVAPRTKYVTVGDRSFAKAAPTLWNSLPFTVRSSKTLGSFKHQLKTHLFRCAYT